MKISINPYIIGKPIDVDWAFVSNKWINLDCSYEEAFHYITVDGAATSAELKDCTRKDSNFVSRTLFMIDIDKGMSIPELFDNNFYNEYGAGFYATPSYTDENPRFRILFRCQTPIIDAIRARKLIRGLLQVYEQADVSCKDSTRLFYGNPNCELKEIRDSLLTDSIVDEITTMIDLFDEASSAKEHVEYPPSTDIEKDVITKILKSCFVGDWGTWRNIGWAMKTSGFSFDQFADVTQGMMKSKTREMAKKVWADGDPGLITMGSIVKFLNDHKPDWRIHAKVYKQHFEEEKRIKELKELLSRTRKLRLALDDES